MKSKASLPKTVGVRGAVLIFALLLIGAIQRPGSSFSGLNSYRL